MALAVWLLGLAAVGLVVVSVGVTYLALGGQPSEPSENRTYYDSLVLDTPQQAVTVFADAFEQQDYLTVYLVLDPLAQSRIDQYNSLLRWNSLLDVSAVESVTDELETLRPLEHSSAGWYLFSNLMVVASRNSAFLVDLSEQIAITGSTVGPSADGTPTVDVAAIVDGVSGEVVFRTLQAPSGAWRIRQVIIPGGSDDQVPWSVPIKPKPEVTTYSIPFASPCPVDGFEPDVDPSSGPRFTVEPTCAEPEEEVTVRGAGFAPNLTGQVVFVPDSEFGITLPLGKILIDQSGTFETVVVLPYRPSDVLQDIEVQVWLQAGS